MPPPVQPIVNLVETAVYVDDLAEAEAFYRDVLGLEPIVHEAGRHVFFRVGAEDVLLVFNPDTTLKGDQLPPHGSRGPGHFAMGILRESLDGWRDRLKQHRVAIEAEATWPHGGRSLYFRDPAGNSIELITPGVWGLPSGW
jgi:catechol 2,3-dioxygenase-like lactoylglutathione lyase family enzyme